MSDTVIHEGGSLARSPDMTELISEVRLGSSPGSLVFEDGRRWRVVRWCEGRRGYVPMGSGPGGSWGIVDEFAGRGFWAVPLAWDGSEDGPMQFFGR